MPSIFIEASFGPSGIVIASTCVSMCVPICLCVYQSWACPHANLSPVQARITKFGPEVQNPLIKNPNVLGVDWS